MTLPLAVARDFVASDTSPDALVPFNDQRYPVVLEPDVPEHVARKLWEVTPRFKDVAMALLDEPLEQYRANDLRSFFVERGLGDLFPDWSEDDVQAIIEDGKIPIYARWAEPLQRGGMALDALMSQSGLQSFAADQEALDARIEAHLD
jgi:hypothetical protein